MAITKIIRLGPDGLIGTAAPFIIVKAGVRSFTFALAACYWVTISV